MKELITHIKQLPGYKLSGRHFKLGSKIHISDFFYAKRLFQNSYFASRFAFILAKYIMRTHGSKIDELRKGVTLIGYGLYSELMISLCESYLKKAWNIEKINHNLISDTEELNLIKGYVDLHDMVIIIVPIASTFSTSIKIEEKIISIIREKVDSKKIEKLSILPPHINVLLISHQDIKKYEKINDVIQIPDVVRQFGWSEIFKDKTVKIDLFTKLSEPKVISKCEHKTQLQVESSRFQKYFLALPTYWNKIENCRECFPGNSTLDKCKLIDCNTCDRKESLKLSCPLNEKPLFTTDKTSVTPALIFNKPFGRTIEQHNRNQKFLLDEKDIKYLHWVRDKSCYNYYIDLELFFEPNKPKIKFWLNTVKKNINYSDTDHVVLFAPGHYTNVGFVNLINTELFSNSANIIHYEPRTDHILNFQSFYKKEIEKASKIIYVDDSITTGNTFIASNRFLKLIRSIIFTQENKINSNGNFNKGFDACIVLMDRTSYFTHENLIRKLDVLDNKEPSFFAYANLHLPSLKNLDGTCPLCKEIEKYDDLIKNSYLDRIKYPLLLHKMKILPKDISVAYNPDSNATSIVKKIEAIHRIYEWFTNSSISIEEYNTFEDWTKALITQTDFPFEADFLKRAEASERNDIFLKVITQFPFNIHLPIKEKAFNWVIQMVFEKGITVYNEINKKSFNYNSFRELKFLIRRAVLIGSNVLFSDTFFELLHILYGPNGIDSVEEKLKNPQNLFDQSKSDTETAIKNLKDFNVFYVIQIKELLLENEARCIQLESQISKYWPKAINLSFKQLLRILQEENGLLIQKFWSFIQETPSWQEFIKFKELNVQNIINILNNPSISNHYRYKALDEFFTKSNQPKIENNSAFYRYLFIMAYLYKEKQEDSYTLSNKTEYLCEVMKEIVLGNTDVNNGCFLIVKYHSKGQDKYFQAYNRGCSRNNIETAINSENSFLIEIIEGKKDNTNQSYITLIEIKRNPNKTWENLYATHKPNEFVEELDSNLINSECNRLILIRINKRKFNDGSTELEDTAQGVFGIYFHCENDEITSIATIRYLLLIRPELSNFIENHHENNEFRDWIDSDNKKRTALLTGHGREMLIKIALDYGEEYKRIVSTILLVQRLVLDYEESDSINIKRDRIKSVFKGLFKSSKDFVNLKYLRSLKTKVENIYDLPEIENPEDCKVILEKSIKADINFPFSIELLDMIFFELIVNAKKNRWIFLKQKSEGKYKTNLIWIDAREEKNQLIISVSNTGPKVDEEKCLKELNRTKSVKPYKTAAGIELIDTILTTFDLGELYFKQEPLHNRLCKFSVELTLNRWHEEDITN
ncbi:MAG: hypothetical protein NTZ69_19105 [Bacteroidia bacterium]|nr:hypothetical protein [Bacteroidia bacterium]